MPKPTNMACPESKVFAFGTSFDRLISDYQRQAAQPFGSLRYRELPETIPGQINLNWQQSASP